MKHRFLTAVCAVILSLFQLLFLLLALLSLCHACIRNASLFPDPSGYERLWILKESFLSPLVLVSLLLFLACLPLNIVLIRKAQLQQQKLEQTIFSQAEAMSQADRSMSALQLQLHRQQYRYEDLCHQLKSGVCTLQLQAELQEDTASLAAISRMNELLDHMLETAGQQAMDKKMTFSSLSLDTLVLETVTDHPQAACIHVDVQPVRLHGDRFFLRELLLALLDNALAACLPSAVVSVTVQGNETSVQIMVSNPGSMNPEELEAAFTRYVSRTPGHYGIGLAMARELAELHFGTLTGSCSSGQVVMTLSLPVSQLEAGCL
ncbi:HAMP domain-containing sensor histidine kinase [uncultured Faecalibaculum sp.]|uniref:sensor histidine kinase n=1 Tax=uncultured Faecalibaculum sp. TaxID=1729681 RepID=UPI00262A7F1B|nr:ATP-binding protein [uncultured Faecalibaculum sp.]